MTEADGMDIKRSGSQPSSRGPAEYFTGTVRVDPLFQAPDPARVSGARPTSWPSAVTKAWLASNSVFMAGRRRYLPTLIEMVLNGKINPGKVFDLTLPLDRVAEGYRAMDERRAIKTLLRP